MAIQTRLFDYYHDDLKLVAEMAWDDALEARPGVLVAPTWAGRTAFEGDKARMLAELGYVGIAIDMYGNGQTGSGADECSALMTSVVSDRAKLQARMAAAVTAAQGLPETSSGPLAAIGFCFGGLCVLDLARSGGDVAGVVSFHGILSAPDNLKEPQIAARVMVLHGYDDPMADPDAMRSFCDEMTRSGCDWQLHAYGQTTHAFTNPNANDPDFGTVYSARAADRSFASMRSFLAEVLS